MDHSQQTQQVTQTRLLAIIAFLLVAFALRQTYAVTMPLAAAFVVIAAVWPVKPWLQRYVPETFSNIGTILALLAVLASFAGAISFSVAQIGQLLAIILKSCSSSTKGSPPGCRAGAARSAESAATAG